MKLGFRGKIYLGIFSLILLLGMFMFLLVSRIMKDTLLEENRNRGISIGANLSARMAEPILAMDFLRMKTLVDETVQLSDDIFYTFVLGAGGKTLAHTFRGGFPIELKAANTVSDRQKYNIQLLDTGTQPVYDYAVPVLIGSDRLGTIRIGLLQTRIQEAIERLKWTVFLSTGLFVLIAGFAGAALAQTVTRRIRILHRSSQQVLRGNLNVQTAPLFKKNCWDIMECDKKECPAYGDLYQRCWYLTGTLCPNCVESEYAQKIANCRNCYIYRKFSGDEIQDLAESFDSMVMSLKNHMSELEQAEATLKEQQSRLVQSHKMESLGLLAAGIAHEINTPLGIILGYTQLLAESAPAGGEMRSDLEIVERQCQICRKIVADLLGFSRHTESTVILFGMNETVDEVVAIVEHTFRLENITIHRAYDPQLPLLKGDREKFKQIFLNLFNNAYDAIAKDGTIHVNTAYDDKHNEIIISVKDNGRGISPDNLDRIFDPFFTTKPVGKGTGLGLSVIFGIIQEHGGTIEVKSPPPASTNSSAGQKDRGTVFIIHIPVSVNTIKGETGYGKNINSG